MNGIKERYYYSGPVKEFDDIINPKWEASTLATTESKAKSNLAYQYKVSHGKSYNSKITLPGKLSTTNRKEAI